tara:strand:- start:6167 stop:6529 length:363 start_codon:yes stop_codon:yes gene_type:complete
MYLVVTDSNQKEGIVTTEDLLNTATNYENTSSKCIFGYKLIVYLVIIILFFILHIIDQNTNHSITDSFNAFQLSLPGYGIAITILAMIPIIITHVVGGRSYRKWHKKYIKGKNLETLECF